jgi:DNA-binding response OmpR family regulator
MTAPLSLLVAESDANTRAIIEISLTLDPLIAVRSAPTVFEAWAILRGVMAFDLLLLDTALTGFSALRTMMAMSSNPKVANVPVVLLATSPWRDDSYRDGADVLTTMAKPFDPLRLSDDLRHHLARHKPSQRSPRA